MISSVNLMTGCNFFYQIISAGRTNGHGGPHVARGPRVGRACLVIQQKWHTSVIIHTYRDNETADSIRNRFTLA